MKSLKYALWLVAVIVSVVVCGNLLSALASRTKWTDDEARAWLANKWADHCKQYGALSNNVIFAYGIETNWGVCIMADGSRVELGFRDDGIVVWRAKR